MLRELREPPGSLVGQRVERLTGRLPQAWQQRDQHVQRGILARARERRPRLAALEQQRIAVLREQVDRTVAVPRAERVSLVLALAMRVDELQHDGCPVPERRAGRVTRRALLVRVAECQRPLLHRCLHVQHEA